MAAEIDIEILADGTVRWNSDKIPDEHHDAADEFQKELEKALGGKVERTHKVGKGRHVHHHGDGHVHEHEHN